MASSQPSKPSGAVVVDANLTIAIASNEASRAKIASAELNKLVAQGYVLYAPSAIITETLYILCNKLTNGILNQTTYAKAITTFERIMRSILSPPNGDKSLIRRANDLQVGYGCSRTNDSFYIALAEQLTNTMPTILLTFDRDLPNQAAKNSPKVTVRLL